MKAYAGIDLHSSNCFIGIIDENDQHLYRRRLRNYLEDILVALAQFKNDLIGVVVESTFNWYWLVDGLQNAGYKVHLANPSAIKQYEGLKHTDDKWDSFWLAHMLRLKILPEGYIYPMEERPIRDMLRRRLLFVGQRTQQILSFKSMVSRNCSKEKMPTNRIKKMVKEDVDELFEHPQLVSIGKHNITTIKQLSETIKLIEREVLGLVKLRPEFIGLKTIPGIGNILALTIMLEVGDIGRFAKVGNFSSYCRCVGSERTSNGKSKGKGNTKNGNKYLSWAYVEAANYARRYSIEAQRFYQRKMAKTNKIVATKALANKLARASYYIMRDQVEYDAKKLFR